MKLCAICHEEVFPEEEIKIKGVPYHTYCYEEEFLDEVSGTGGSVGYNSAAFTMNFDDEDEDDKNDGKEKALKEEAIDSEIIRKIDEMSSTASIVGYQNPIGMKTGNKINKDPYKKDRKNDHMVIDDDEEIRNDGSRKRKIHPVNKLSDILKK